jgi:6-phosphogluconate dehydrogenase (decarboxylating)
MIDNGVEYGMIETYAEGFGLREKDGLRQAVGDATRIRRP